MCFFVYILCKYSSAERKEREREREVWLVEFRIQSKAIFHYEEKNEPFLLLCFILTNDSSVYKKL